MRAAAALAVLGAVLAAPGETTAGGRWYAWIDRVPAGAAEAAARRWRARGVQVRIIPSDRFAGVEPGYAYLVAGESLFESEVRTRVEALAARRVGRAGVQYFSDRRPPGLDAALGVGDREPLFVVEADVDGVAPEEVLALVRRGDAGSLHVVRRHGDGTFSTLARHRVDLPGLPAATQGERARAYPLVEGGVGRVVAFEAAFDTGEMKAVWTLFFVLRDLGSPPVVALAPGARAPVRITVEPGHDEQGRFTYALTVEGTEPVTRRLVWDGRAFVDAR